MSEYENKRDKIPYRKCEEKYMKFDSLKDKIEINNLAYEIEKKHPELSFFEVNKLVVESQQKETFAQALERLVHEPEEVWITNLYVGVYGYDPRKSEKPKLRIVK